MVLTLAQTSSRAEKCWRWIFPAKHTFMPTVYYNWCGTAIALFPHLFESGHEDSKLSFQPISSKIWLGLYCLNLSIQRLTSIGWKNQTMTSLAGSVLFCPLYNTVSIFTEFIKINHCTFYPIQVLNLSSTWCLFISYHLYENSLYS